RWNIDGSAGGFSNSSQLSRTVARLLAAALDGKPPALFSNDQLKDRFSAAHASCAVPVLPPHECYVVRVGTAPIRIFTSAHGGVFDPVADEFAQIDHYKECGIPLDGAAAGMTEHLRTYLHERLGLIIPIEPIKVLRDNGFYLRTASATHVLFHSRAASDLIVIFWMTLGPDASAHLPALLVGNWDFPGDYALMLPLASGLPVLSNPLLKAHPALQRSLIGNPRFRSPQFDSSRVGPYIVCAAPPDSIPGYRLLVCRRLASDDPWPFSRVCILGFLIFLASTGIFVAGERIVFERGPALTVRRLLPGAFLAVALLPLTGAGVMINRYMFESEMGQKTALQRDLHDELVDIDEGERAHIASFSNYLRSLKHRVQFDRFAGIPDDPDDIENYFLRFLREFNVLNDWVVNTILVVASDGRNYSLKSIFSDVAPPQIISTIEDNPLVRYMLLRGLHALGVQTILENRKSEGAALAEAVKQETFQDILMNLAGLSTYVSVAFQTDRLFEIKFLHESNFSLDTQMTFAPGLTINLTWVWGCRALDKPYLRDLFERSTHAPSSDRTVVMSGLKFERTISPPSFADERDRFGSLHELLNTGFQTQQSIRRITSDPGHPVQEVYPARHLRGVIAGQRSTAPIEENIERLGRNATIGLAVVVAGAVFLGVLAGVFFLLPLSELQRGITAISDGTFAVRLDTSRCDEFGSIATAFNHMAKGLQEGLLLKSFVSDSVLEVIRSGDAKRTPRSCDVTILFSSFVGFEEFATTHGAAEVFSVLQAHLSVIDALVTRHGGEIDKIIIDKVMLVFRHDEMGGGAAAVAAALNVARDVGPELAKTGILLDTAIGMNTGSVLSGVIGAGERLDHTVIGDPVNLAARLSVLAHTTGGHRIVLARSVRDLAPHGTKTRKLPFKEVKGKTQKIEAYELI
ncbi:MAG TPA: adenylate/guanylate cyclase domain-containing protein, partial [Candidatus Ozemobacteraceae bacterium]|nr:adenylate/guanylate cyclase domain-containing protein [Candidatus Ozemobacteraceae bacterium]